MSDLQKFIKSSGIYFIGSILNKLIAFFMLPIYTRYLSPTEFGEYDLSSVYMNLFIGICFIDIYIGIMKFLLDDKNNSIANYKEKILFAGFFIFFVCSFFYIGSFLVFLKIFDVKFSILLVFLGIVTYLHTIYSYICRAYELNHVFVVSGLVSTVVIAILNSILLVYWEFGYEALFYTSIIGIAVAIFMMELRLKLISKLRIGFGDFTFVKPLFLYSFPLVSFAFSYWFAEFYGKFSISQNIGLKENGYYAIALKFSMLLMLLISCFKMAWQEINFSKVLDKNLMSSYYTKAVNEYIKFLLLGGSFFIIFIKFIFLFVVNEAYYHSFIYIPASLFVCLSIGVYDFMANIINKINYNKYVPKISIFVVTVNFLFIYFFIDKIGVFSVIFGFIFQYIFAFYMLKSLVKKKFEITVLYSNVLYLVIFIVSSFICLKFDTFFAVINLFLLLIFCLWSYRESILKVRSYLWKK